jgi:apolipoprotein N-acyltransferase
MATIHALELIHALSIGANGPDNLHDQQLRAIENGLTLFRCISQGISGIIEPVIHGHFEQKTAVIANQVVFFSLPLQKRIKTVYSAYLGDSIPLACILYSLNFVASLLYHHMKRIVK